MPLQQPPPLTSRPCWPLVFGKSCRTPGFELNTGEYGTVRQVGRLKSVRRDGMCHSLAHTRRPLGTSRSCSPDSTGTRRPSPTPGSRPPCRHSCPAAALASSRSPSP
eukprot:1031408-Prymnesium_polylepis.1